MKNGANASLIQVSNVQVELTEVHEDNCRVM